jgi:predicted RND superfamily exporter protein
MPSLIEILLNRRHLLAVLTLGLGAIVAWGMGSTTMDASYNSILSESDPYKEEVDQARKDFPPSTSVLFAFEADPSIFNDGALAAMDALTQRYSEVDGSAAYSTADLTTPTPRSMTEII